jgi:hypothetical protein
MAFGMITDRNGEPFDGTPAELKRHNNKLCKRAARSANPDFTMPYPAGLQAAMGRICKAADCSPQELFSTTLVLLDRLLTAGDSQEFKKRTQMTVTIGNLDKWLPLIGEEPIDSTDKDE